MHAQSEAYATLQELFFFWDCKAQFHSKQQLGWLQSSAHSHVAAPFPLNTPLLPGCCPSLKSLINPICFYQSRDMLKSPREERLYMTPHYFSNPYKQPCKITSEQHPHPLDAEADEVAACRSWQWNWHPGRFPASQLSVQTTQVLSSEDRQPKLEVMKLDP